MSIGTRISRVLLIALAVNLFPATVALAEQAAYLGVRLGEESERSGVRITHVVEGSPADESGLAEGDVILRFGGERIEGPLSVTRRIQERKPGDAVSIVILRDGEERTVRSVLRSRVERFGPSDGGTTMLYPFGNPGEWQARQDDVRKRLEELGERLGERYADAEYWQQFVDSEASDPFRFYVSPGFDWQWSRPKLGVQLVETTPELREHLGGGEEQGVLVSKVLSGTPAERYGVEVGDLIVSVAGEPVATPDDLVEALSDKVGKTFAIDLVRDGRAVEIEVTIPDSDRERPSGPRA
jgi:S1-C subfamily serine protease